MIDFAALAMNLLQSNPNVKNNPMAQQAFQAIQNGDSKTGEQIAKNLCASYNTTPEEAYKQAMNFFHIQ